MYSHLLVRSWLASHVSHHPQRKSSIGLPFIFLTWIPLGIIFSVTVSFILCLVHPRVHVRHVLRQYSHVCYDLSSPAATAAVWTLKMALISSLCLLVEKYRALFKHQFMMDPLVKLSSGCFSPLRIFHTKTVHCVSLCFIPPFYSEPATLPLPLSQMAQLQCTVSSLLNAPEFETVWLFNIEFQWHPSFTNLTVE